MDKYEQKEEGYFRRAKLNRRSMVGGFTVSAVLHCAFIVFYSLGIEEWYLGDIVSAPETTAGSMDGIRVIRIVETDLIEEESEVIEDLPKDPILLVEMIPLELDQSGDENSVEAEFELRASEILKIKNSDDRLWRKAQPEVFELNEVEIMELMLAGRLEIWVDSVYQAMEAENALTDWTKTDSEGKRWGVSPGRLHLGDVSIPLPVYFGQNSWQRERSTRKAWEDRDILNASRNIAIRSSWRERAEAIRRRKNRERENSVAPPDTIGN
ncbi:MAG: hypothetical protein OSA24_06545 [Longimicrobiales bacterium]|nr:hypothetical protein [Longimicrobiales bacterium]